jgi:hypothetical protein
MKAVLLQFGCFAFERLIEKVYLHHLTRCKLYGYDYIAETKLVQSKRPSWEKVRMIREALLAGYDKVFWLDADAIWIKDDLSNALIDIEHIGMCWHDCEVYGPHFNCGAMYLNSTPLVRKLVNEWYYEPDTEHVWQDQWGLINVMKKMQVSPIQRIDNRWNSVLPRPDLSSPNPAVLAWHGHNDRAFSELPNYVQS